jgi:alkylated DNA repair dioxygenase AlkB
MTAKCWYWKQGVPKEVCDLILAEATDSRFRPGETREESGDEYRNNNIFFLGKSHWFEAVLLNFARLSNQESGWNYDWRDCETVQISRYQPGQRYEWHADENIFREAEAIRKLTVVCQLNDPNEYVGGGLYVEGLEENMLEHQGDVIVFPSIVQHTAKRIESGQRMSAALWVTGPQFR